jgi:DNA-binding transcriptional ArsR family regulator
VAIESKPACSHEGHSSQRFQIPVNEPAIERTARIFRALGEPARIRLLARLAQGEACVTELAELEGESITVISQRLRVLRADNIVGRRRDGKHILYYLADQHVLDLVFNGLAHASERPLTAPATENSRLMALFRGNPSMSNHEIHENHTHQHGKDCGHTAIAHNGHTDYLHDGHLHSLHEGHVDEHKLDVNVSNPADCTNGHKCDGHDAQHKHGKNCGHEAVPHGDHIDYLVKGHLHHPDADHCDNHGAVQLGN